MLHTSEVKGELWASVRKATETPRIHGAAEKSFYVLIYPPPGVWFPHLSTALTKETPHSHVRSDNAGVCPPEGALPLSYWPTQLMERLLQRRMLGWGELVNPSAEEQERARGGCRRRTRREPYREIGQIELIRIFLNFNGRPILLPPVRKNHKSEFFLSPDFVHTEHPDRKLNFCLTIKRISFLPCLHV